MMLSRYPFLTTLDEYTASVLGVRLSFAAVARDESIASLALEWLKRASSRSGDWPRPANVDEAVLSFHLAVALASKLGRHVVDALATYVSETVKPHLKMEDEGSLASILRKLGVHVERRPVSIPWLVDSKGRVYKRNLGYAIPLSDYLRVFEDNEGSLTNAFLRGGLVYADKLILEDVTAAAVRARVRLLAGKYSDEDVPEDLVSKGRLAFEEGLARRKWRLLPLVVRALPPCIRRIASKLSSNNSLTDEEAYLLVTFLGGLEYEVAGLAEALDLDDNVARGLALLARYARVKGYTVYTCEAARSLGLCPEECSNTNPLATYARNLKRAAAGGGDAIGESP